MDGWTALKRSASVDFCLCLMSQCSSWHDATWAEYKYVRFFLEKLIFNFCFVADCMLSVGHPLYLVATLSLLCETPVRLHEFVILRWNCIQDFSIIPEMNPCRPTWFLEPTAKQMGFLLLLLLSRCTTFPAVHFRIKREDFSCFPTFTLHCCVS